MAEDGREEASKQFDVIFRDIKYKLDEIKKKFLEAKTEEDWESLEESISDIHDYEDQMHEYVMEYFNDHPLKNVDEESEGEDSEDESFDEDEIGSYL